MLRRPLSLLLMLFLLLSQQVTLSHPVSHLAAAMAAASGEPVVFDDSEAAGHSCALCIAAAQYATAIPVSLHTLVPVEPARDAYFITLDHSVHPPVALGFRSRAPPAP